MQTLFAPGIQQAFLRQALEIIQTKFSEVPEYGLISDGIQTWKGLKDYWSTVKDTKKYCKNMQQEIRDLQKQRDHWNPFLVGFYNSSIEQSKRWEDEQKAFNEQKRRWDSSGAANANAGGADATMANNPTTS